MDSEISLEYPDITGTADSDPAAAAALRRAPDPVHRPPPPSKHDNCSRFLVVVLQGLVMASLFFLFFLFAGVAAVALIHLFVAGRSLRRRRRRSPGASKAGTGLGLSQHELRLLPVSRYSGKGARMDAADCAVCLEGIREGDRCRVLPACRHVFHRGCVDKWLVRSPACPVCRMGVRTC